MAIHPCRPEWALLAALALAAFPYRAVGQTRSTLLADLHWRAQETDSGRFVIVPGERAFVAGYNRPGLEIWTPPLQVARRFWISMRLEGDTIETDGRTTLRSIDATTIATTREYSGSGFAVRERVFTPRDLAGATIAYSVQALRPVLITIHFTPSLNLMWPAAVGGQEIHWDGAHSAYVLDEPSRRFRAVILAPHIVANERVLNNRRDAEFERSISFTVRVTTDAEARVTFAGSSTPDEDPLAIAESLTTRTAQYEGGARERYASVAAIDLETPDSAVNRALRWAQVTLEQAWVCNPQLGCGLVAGYGPSRGARRPQYAWFFAGDGLVAVDALLREGAYARARDELAFIMRYQNKRTGAIWHELSQSAGFLDWENGYPYMFVHVDISFDFLDAMRDYVTTTGDVGFATDHWAAIRAAYEYCRSTIGANGVLPEIPAGQQGRDEQDPQRDELTLSLAWVRAAKSFAVLARLTNHSAFAADAESASGRARAAIRPAYYDARRGTWASGHLRSGAAVSGLTSSATALLHNGLLTESEQRLLLDQLASPAYRAPWGIRSTPTTSALYDPDSYARGSVWAIGTADAIMAFYEANRAPFATALWHDLVPWFALDAPGHMHEVLRGDLFAAERESVPDQTWSAAAFISSAIRGVLGLTVDATQRELRFAPHMPPDWDSLRVRHIDVGGGSVDLTLRTLRERVDLEVVNAGPAMTVVFRPSLTNGVQARETRVSCPPRQTTRLTLTLGR